MMTRALKTVRTVGDMKKALERFDDNLPIFGKLSEDEPERHLLEVENWAEASAHWAPCVQVHITDREW